MSYLFQSLYQLTQGKTDRDCLDEKLKEDVAVVIKTINQELFEIQSQKQAEFYIQKVELAIANHEGVIKSQLQSNDSIIKAKHPECCLCSLD